MEIYRGPRTTTGLQSTDKKTLKEEIEAWKPTKILEFDGTIDKDGQRHTAIGVQISEEDVISLSSRLYRVYQDRIQELEKRIESLSEASSEKSENLDKFQCIALKLHNLVGEEKRAKAPSNAKLLETVEEILWNVYVQGPKIDKPKIPWLNWESL